MELTHLVGKTIKAVDWDGTNLYIATNVGNFELSPYGDCCAHCYVQHIDGSEALQGATVKEIQDVGGESSGDRDSCEVSDVWAHRIHTDKGICTIEMRVDHNGWYGGQLDMSEYNGGNVQGNLQDF